MLVFYCQIANDKIFLRSDLQDRVGIFKVILINFPTRCSNKSVCSCRQAVFQRFVIYDLSDRLTLANNVIVM
jgi:hypothetical protein